jgi:hypothetical protein
MSMAASLAENALWSNLGVAGPLDMRSPKVMTHMLVHRSHHAIFGSLYPKELSNTEHDEWISHVYGYKNTFLHTAVQARELILTTLFNTQTHPGG